MTPLEELRILKYIEDMAKRIVLLEEHNRHLGEEMGLVLDAIIEEQLQGRFQSFGKRGIFSTKEGDDEGKS